MTKRRYGYKKYLLFIVAAIMIPTVRPELAHSKVDLLAKIVGMKYPSARKELIRAGYVPFDQRSLNSGYCIGHELICSAYKEVVGCATDVHEPCRFEWTALDNRKFFIVTYGVNLKNQEIVGYSFE